MMLGDTKPSDIDFYALEESEQTLAMETLARDALPFWGLACSELSLIKYRENAVFAVKTKDGERYALRIHRYAYHSDEELRSELQWIAALEEYGIEVPSVKLSDSGELFVTVKTDSVPEHRQVDVFEWVDGEQLGAVETGLNENDQSLDEGIAQTYHTIGQIAARLHNQATEWKVPDNFTRHAWDADGLVGDAPFWGEFWQLQSLSEEEKELLLKARDRARTDLEAYAASRGDKDLYSMIHADFVAENLMVDGPRVRLIDFDDAGFGWHLFEIATALYFEMEEAHYQSAYDSLIRGYREFRSLNDSELAFMPLFFLLRSFTYLGWIHTRFETKTAQELAPMLTRKACTLARAYLQ